MKSPKSPFHAHDFAWQKPALPFVALTNDRERAAVAQQVSVNFLAAPKGGKLIATAHYKKDGRSSCVVNVDVVDDTGREIAQFVGTGFKLLK